MRYVSRSNERVISDPVPVKCDYCNTVALIKVQNCISCGGPLNWPQEVVEVIERRIDISLEMLDITSFADTSRQYIVGRKSAILSENVVRRSREGS